MSASYQDYLDLYLASFRTTSTYRKLSHTIFSMNIQQNKSSTSPKSLESKLNIEKILHGDQPCVSLSHSLLFSIDEGKNVFVAAPEKRHDNTCIKIWNQNGHSIDIDTKSDEAYGFSHFKIDNQNFLGSIFSNALKIYKIEEG